jgi:hypothetical protein
MLMASVTLHSGGCGSFGLTNSDLQLLETPSTTGHNFRFMGSSFDSKIDQAMLGVLVRDGYLKCGPSRAYVEFESRLAEHAKEFCRPEVQREFADVCAEYPSEAGSSKLDYQGVDDPRGHKLSLQLEYDLVRRLAWRDVDLRPSFHQMAVSAVRLVAHDVARSPLRVQPAGGSQVRSTVRGILYLPGEYPGVGWHTDGCLYQFISIPAEDRSLYVHQSSLPLLSNSEPENEPGAVRIEGGSVAETVMLLGRQVAMLVPGARATPHAVSQIKASRTVATHFVWLREQAERALAG